MTVTDALAQREAELAYAKVYDRFSDLEQTYVGSGIPVLANDAHGVALIAISASRAEMDDRDVGSEIMRVELAAALGEVSAILRRHRAEHHDTNAREGWR